MYQEKPRMLLQFEAVIFFTNITFYSLAAPKHWEETSPLKKRPWSAAPGMSCAICHRGVLGFQVCRGYIQLLGTRVNGNTSPHIINTGLDSSCLNATNWLRVWEESRNAGSKGFCSTHEKCYISKKKKREKKVDERSLYFYIAERKYWVSVAIFSPKESVIESKWHNEKMSGKAWSSEKVAGIIAF